MSLSNITLNGMPLAIALEAQRRVQLATESNAIQKDTTKSLGFIVAHSRGSNSSRVRNHSGSRTGKGRVIYSASWGGGVV